MGKKKANRKASQADTDDARLERLEAEADKLAELQAQAEAEEELKRKDRHERLWEDS